MNKALIIAAVLVSGAAGFMLAQGTLKAQDATDNSAMGNMAMPNAMANSDTGSAANTENAEVPAAPAAAQ